MQQKNASKGRHNGKRSKNALTIEKSKDNFETIKSRIDTEIDKTIDNMIIFSKKKTKNATVHKRRTKNKRVISSVADRCFNKQNEKRMSSLESTLKTVPEKQSHFDIRHMRLKSLNIASPSLNILLNNKKVNKNKMRDKKQIRSVSSLNSIDKANNSQGSAKMYKRVIESLSLPKSTFNKEARLSYDAADLSSKINSNKHFKSFSKDIKRVPGNS